jgi:hypothetical protein
MTASQIIDEIVALPPVERAEVIRFARSLDINVQLSGDELTALASRLAETTDASQAMALRDSIEQGFYGKKPHA